MAVVLRVQSGTVDDLHLGFLAREDGSVLRDTVERAVDHLGPLRVVTALSVPGLPGDSVDGRVPDPAMGPDGERDSGSGVHRLVRRECFPTAWGCVAATTPNGKCATPLSSATRRILLMGTPGRRRLGQVAPFVRTSSHAAVWWHAPADVRWWRLGLWHHSKTVDGLSVTCSDRSTSWSSGESLLSWPSWGRSGSSAPRCSAPIDTATAAIRASGAHASRASTALSAARSMSRRSVADQVADR